jgi:hypothetical protein
MKELRIRKSMLMPQKLKINDCSNTQIRDKSVATSDHTMQKNNCIYEC